MFYVNMVGKSSFLKVFGKAKCHLVIFLLKMIFSCVIYKLACSNI